MVKKPHNISLRVILKDLLLVDKMAQHDPQYELILCSDGKEIFSNSPTGDTSMDTEEDDIFSYEGDFLVNILFDQCSSLSMDYPRTRYKLEEPNIRKLAVQCTAVNAIGKESRQIQCLISGVHDVRAVRKEYSFLTALTSWTPANIYIILYCLIV